MAGHAKRLSKFSNSQHLPSKEISEDNEFKGLNVSLAGIKFFICTRALLQSLSIFVIKGEMVAKPNRSAAPLDMCTEILSSQEKL